MGVGHITKSGRKARDAEKGRRRKEKGGVHRHILLLNLTLFPLRSWSRFFFSPLPLLSRARHCYRNCRPLSRQRPGSLRFVRKGFFSQNGGYVLDLPSNLLFADPFRDVSRFFANDPPRCEHTTDYYNIRFASSSRCPCVFGSRMYIKCAWFIAARNALASRRFLRVFLVFRFVHRRVQGS